MGREAFESMGKSTATPGVQRAMGGDSLPLREDFLLSTGQPGGLDTLVPAAKGHTHTQRMEASMLPRHQHFTSALPAFGLQEQRSSLEARPLCAHHTQVTKTRPEVGESEDVARISVLAFDGDLARRVPSPSYHSVICGMRMRKPGC